VTALVLLVGAVAGLGLWLLVLGIRPRPRRLDRALDALSREPEPPLASAILAVGGGGTGIVFPAAASLVMAVAGWWMPELSAASAAREYQAAFRHALGSFLDLVVIATAGGAGVDQALDDAAKVGHGPAYAELRYALAEARLARIPPWDTLAQLGARVRVPELEQLAATIGLAGSEGAKVRASLQSRAATMRTKQITDIEGRAASATERMSLPIVILFGAFFILIGFPALATILTSL
jgi:tight adherence protein C